MPKPRDFTALDEPHLRKRLDRLASRIADPVLKLRFIQKTLEAYEARPALARKLPLARGLLLYYCALEAYGAISFTARRRQVRLPRLPLYTVYRLRRPLFLTVAGAMVWAGLEVGALGYRKGREGADWLVGQIMPPPTVAVTLSPAALETKREDLPPRHVWLASEEGGEELWSNGLRVLTRFETEGEPRRFYAFPRDGGEPVALGPSPVGIVYHASESDMAPFAEQFSSDILETTHDLLGWLSRRGIYHYVIDRFGRVYRIVSDDGVAVHAGVSIWGDEDYYYLNLNESFIGVAFESQWSAGGDLITNAQVQAAVNLTDMLRARYNIVDENCVPHGLVSVNGSRGLIGYHADWARNFPFAALGLRNNYEIAPASITAYGFHYDDELVARLGGKLWPGVDRAERELEARAEEEGLEIRELRQRLLTRYRSDVELAKIQRGAMGRSVAAGR